MSPYVVPDRAQERKLPTALTPTFWAALTIVPFDTPDPAQPKVILDDVPPHWQASSEESTNTRMQPSKLADPPHVQHEYYFFDDGNISFLVEGILYRVHQYFFCRDSSEFKDRISKLSTQQDSGSPPIISLHDVTSMDFDAFLSVLYPQNFNKLEERPFEAWSSILDLSTRWGFTSIRDLALRRVEPPNPLQRLILARKYTIEQWIMPALLELCERQEPLSLDEARLMDFGDVVLVGSVRQTVRSPTLTVNGAGIRECIQAWRNGEPWRPVPDPPEACAESPLSRPPSPPSSGGTPQISPQASPIPTDTPSIFGGFVQSCQISTDLVSQPISTDWGWGSAGKKKKGKKK